MDNPCHLNDDSRNAEGSLVFDGQKKLVTTVLGGEIGLAFGVAILLVCAQLGRAAWGNVADIGNPWGWAMIICGLLVSLPGGIMYHVRLAQCLRPRGLLHRGWIWHPTRLHDLLPASERTRVLIWFRLGAAGWAVTILGCVVVAWSLFI
jgi:hypothetical protein